MYKLVLSTNTIRCVTTPTRVNLFTHTKPSQQIRHINIQQTNVTGYYGRGPKKAEKNFQRAEKDRAERSLLYAKVRERVTTEESQRRFKKIPASILQAEQITEQILNEFTEKHYDDALQLFEEKKKSGIQFGTRAYSVALRVLAYKQDLETATKYFADLLKEKVPLQVQLIDPILSGFAAQKKENSVREWFQKISELKLSPTVDSYNALMSVLPTEEEITTAFADLKMKGLQPNIHSYNSAMRRFAELGRFDRVWDMYLEARTHHVRPNAYFWVNTIQYCTKFGQIDYLERVLLHMADSHQTKLDYRHWTALIRAFTCLGRWDRLYDMVDEMRKRKQPFDPRIILALTASFRASDLVRGYLEFPLNQLHVVAHNQAASQVPKISNSTARLFLGFLNDIKPVLMANVFHLPPAIPSATTAPVAAQV